MKHLIIMTIVTIFFLNPLSGQNTDRSVSFSGKVMRGDSFVLKISNNLIFKLLPYSDDGWYIWIGEGEIAQNFCSVATPPFRGLNATIIEGWHFRNEDNTGPNDGSVNAPQSERDFKFVMNLREYSVAENFVRTVLWPHEFTPEEIESASDEFSGLKFGGGKLFITDMKLGNLFAGERVCLEYIEFEVELENFR